MYDGWNSKKVSVVPRCLFSATGKKAKEEQIILNKHPTMAANFSSHRQSFGTWFFHHLTHRIIMINLLWGNVRREDVSTINPHFFCSRPHRSEKYIKYFGIFLVLINNIGLDNHQSMLEPTHARGVPFRDWNCVTSLCAFMSADKWSLLIIQISTDFMKYCGWGCTRPHQRLFTTWNMIMKIQLRFHRLLSLFQYEILSFFEHNSSMIFLEHRNSIFACELLHVLWIFKRLSCDAEWSSNWIVCWQHNTRLRSSAALIPYRAGSGRV